MFVYTRKIYPGETQGDSGRSPQEGDVASKETPTSVGVSLPFGSVLNIEEAKQPPHSPHHSVTKVRRQELIRARPWNDGDAVRFAQFHRRW